MARQEQQINLAKSGEDFRRIWIFLVDEQAYQYTAGNGVDTALGIHSIVWITGIKQETKHSIAGKAVEIGPYFMLVNT